MDRASNDAGINVNAVWAKMEVFCKANETAAKQAQAAEPKTLADLAAEEPGGFRLT